MKFPPHRNASQTCWKGGSLQNIYGKVATSTLNTSYLLFMTVFMWNRSLNSVSQEIIIQKKLKKKSDGTNTQVVAQMMNKCRGRMVQKDYIMGNIFHKVGGEKNRERGPQQSQLPLYFVYVIYMSTCLLGHGVHSYQLLSNSLKPSSLTHSLQIYCTGLTEPRSHTIWAWAANCDPTTNN